jgi:hypothetical protein
MGRHWGRGARPAGAPAAHIAPPLPRPTPPHAACAPTHALGPRPFRPPGIDGTGLAAHRQFPSLTESFDLRCLVIPPADRSSFEQLLDTVEVRRRRRRRARRGAGAGAGAGAGGAAPLRAAAGARGPLQRQSPARARTPRPPPRSRPRPPPTPPRTPLRPLLPSPPPPAVHPARQHRGRRPRPPGVPAGRVLWRPPGTRARGAPGWHGGPPGEGAEWVRAAGGGGPCAPRGLVGHGCMRLGSRRHGPMGQGAHQAWPRQARGEGGEGAHRTGFAAAAAAKGRRGRPLELAACRGRGRREPWPRGGAPGPSSARRGAARRSCGPPHPCPPPSARCW